MTKRSGTVLILSRADIVLSFAAGPFTITHLPASLIVSLQSNFMLSGPSVPQFSIEPREERTSQSVAALDSIFTPAIGISSNCSHSRKAVATLRSALKCVAAAMTSAALPFDTSAATSVSHFSRSQRWVVP